MRIPLILCSFLIAPALGAQQPAADRDRFTIGLGAGIGPSYDGSDDYRVRPGGIIQGRVSGFNFAMRGLNLYVDAVREAPAAPLDIVAGPVVQLQTNRSGGIEDAQVRALGTIAATVELGGYAGVGLRGVAGRTDTLSFDLAFVHDVGGVHGSYVVTPSLSYFTPVGRRTFALAAVNADFAGGGFRRTYFDVTPVGSAASGLAPYATTGAGFTDAGASLLVGRALGADPRRGWSLFALGSYSRLLGEAARSPIVRDAGSRNQWFGVAGVAYSF